MVFPHAESNQQTHNRSWKQNYTVGPYPNSPFYSAGHAKSTKKFIGLFLFKKHKKLNFKISKIW